MSGSVTTALVTASCILAVIAAIAGFCFALSRALVRGPESAAAVAVVAAAVLVFVIGGGYVWFRFMSVLTHAPGA